MRMSPVGSSIFRASLFSVILLSAAFILVGIFPWLKPGLRGTICLTGLGLVGLLIFAGDRLINAANRFEREFWDKCVLDENDERVLAALDFLIERPDSELEACALDGKVLVRFVDEVVAEIELKMASAERIRSELRELRDNIRATYHNREWPDEPTAVAWWREKMMPLLGTRSGVSGTEQ